MFRPGHSRLLWVIILRPVVLTPILAFAALPASGIGLPSLWKYWTAVYALSLLHLCIARRTERETLSLYLQILGDMGFITLLIHHFSDPSSIFIPLYLLVIAYASLLDQRRGGTAATLLSTVCYLAVIGIGQGGWLGSGTSALPLREALARTLVNVMSFAAIGYLGTSLSQRLQSMRAELGRKDDSLAELRALHQNIIKSIRSGLVTTDLQGHVTSFNPAAEEIMGISEGEMLGESCRRLIGEGGMRRLESADFSRLKRGLRGEVRLEAKLGRTRCIGFSIYPLRSPSGRTLGFTISFQDLSQIKKLEQRLRLKDRMATIGSLAASIAHELRNPLGAIAGSVQVLKTEMGESPDQKQLLDIVLRESDRLNKIIENLLHYTRLDRPARSEVRADQLLEEVLRLLRNDPAWASFRIHVRGQQALPACMADADQLKQVYWNVLSNAAKAMPRGGDITIRLWGEGRYLKIAFRDTGIGMTQQEQLRMFQPFVRRFERGAGLGMTIVYQIVQAHRGKISVQSRRDLGTTITVALPTAVPPFESPAPKFGDATSDKRYSAVALP